ncbi:MAG TPA: hypothetical protein VEA69_11620 [Tepidisphaeraceae bacterium]|nr:hypothetical protein [Tepidisphaeraceae bacterium]
MYSDFDLLGGFVVKLVPPTQGRPLREALRRLGFTTYALDLAGVRDKSDLFGRLHGALGLGELVPGVPTGWDGMSDCLWQRVTLDGLTNAALVLRATNAALARNLDMIFQLAEVWIQLEQAVCEARREAGEPPFRARLFIEHAAADEPAE